MNVLEKSGEKGRNGPLSRTSTKKNLHTLRINVIQ